MFDLSDPNTYWLTVTNIGLGIVTLSFLIYAIPAFLKDLWQVFWKRETHDKEELSGNPLVW